MSEDDHIAVKISGVLYVKLEEAKKLRAELDRIARERDEARAEIERLRGALQTIAADWTLPDLGEDCEYERCRDAFSDAVNKVCEHQKIAAAALALATPHEQEKPHAD
jgi:hypothetical protein